MKRSWKMKLKCLVQKILEIDAHEGPSQSSEECAYYNSIIHVFQKAYLHFFPLNLSESAEQICWFSLNTLNSQIPPGLKPGAGNSTQDSYMSSKDSEHLSCHCCLLESTLAGAGSRRWTWALNLSTVI